MAFTADVSESVCSSYYPRKLLIHEEDFIGVFFLVLMSLLCLAQ